MLEAIMVSGLESPGERPLVDEQPLADDDEGIETGGDPFEDEGPSGVWAGKRVVDLYAGTGALGIEALSRGARQADFVDASPTCQRLIRDNLRVTGLTARGRVIGGALPAALEARALDPYDVALLDPPYGDPSLEVTLAALGERGLLSTDALVVVEHSRRGEPAESYGRLRLIRRRRHGDTEISIYRREG
jgi:16S rRNA (guanine(966)-N(2))-methyltransferase RsmD